MAMSIDDRAHEAREQDETEDIAAFHLEQAWNDLQSVPSYAEYWQRQRVCADCGESRPEVDCYSKNAVDAYCNACIDRYAEYERAAKFSDEQAQARELERANRWGIA